ALDVQALEKALLTLAGDPQRLQKMKVQARQYMQERSTQEAFVQSWEMYGDGSQRSEIRVQRSVVSAAAGRRLPV
ncbi:MAG: hypothetical protein R6U55_09630, partial [Desulfovermiculus sp.]